MQQFLKANYNMSANLFCVKAAHAQPGVDL